MDILNFISWIKGKRIVTTVAPSQTLIPVGLKDGRRDDDYLAGAITAQNFINQIATVIPGGSQGPIGPQGVPGPVGPAGLNWQGAWSAAGTYVIDDAVGYAGASWFCVANVGPFPTPPNLDPTNWALLASQGSPGSQGPQGIQGVPGPSGSGLPYWVEINGTDLTVWNNGKGNVTSNTSFGQFALKSNTTGQNNSTYGYLALTNNTTGNENTAFGYNALASNTSATNNTAIGSLTLIQNTTGVDNTAIGRACLLSNTVGSSNTGVGSGAFFLNTTGFSNTAIGTNSMVQNTTGQSNTVIGAYAMASTSTTSSTVVIGANATTTTGTNSSIILGTDAIGNGSNQLVVGSSTNYVGATGSATGFATTANTFVGGSALPALAKFLTIKINGTDYKIPLYNV
jgi:hypothetical protein